MVFAICFALLTNWADAAGYPERPITVVNPWTAGGPADTVARPVLEQLSSRLRQPAILENRAGANGTIGSSYVARAKPDGYTLLFSHVGPITISPAVQRKMPYDSVKDLVPITQIVSAPNVLVVRPDLPIHSLAELVSYARSHPGKLSYGSVGAGSTTHLAGEILAHKANIELLHVPYKGAAPVITGLMGKEIDIAFLNAAGVNTYLESGKLRGLAVTTLQRSAMVPELPAIAEVYPGFEVNSWYGLMAPAGTPKAVIDLLQKNVAQILKSPEIVKFFEQRGLAPEGTTPQAYAAQIQRDLKRWQQVVRQAGLERR